MKADGFGLQKRSKVQTKDASMPVRTEHGNLNSSQLRSLAALRFVSFSCQHRVLVFRIVGSVQMNVVVLVFF